MSPAIAITPDAAEIIDYDALYADYSQSLVDTLRGFSAKVPGLELWVPDENLRVSLVNLLDSAASLGRSSVCLLLGPGSATQLSEAELLELGRGFGQARLERRGAGLLLEVTDVGSAAAASPTGPQLRPAPERLAPTPDVAGAALPAAAGVSFDGYEQALRRLPPAGVFASHGAGLALQVSEDACTLALVVSPSGHVVASASGEAPDSARQLLLAELCRTITGLPILEACYHGALRLEHRLRPADQPRPVSGIALPRAVHPHFALVERLLHAALGAYRALSGYAETHSEYDDRPGRAWLSASADERRRLLEVALAALLPGLGLTAGDVSVGSVRYDVRVELGLGEAWKQLDQPRLVMALERELQARVDPRLEVYVQELKDKNQLRRLALVETP